jgi:hypothetical protein
MVRLSRSEIGFVGRGETPSAQEEDRLSLMAAIRANGMCFGWDTTEKNREGAEKLSG